MPPSSPGSWPSRERRRGDRRKTPPSANPEANIPPPLILSGMVLRYVLPAFAAVMGLIAAVSLVVSIAALVIVAQDGREFRDQICERDEESYGIAVANLQATYDYLIKLPDEKLEDPLNATILQRLPTTEANARAARPPADCYEPGVGAGLAEPKFPARPEGLPQPQKRPRTG